MEAKQGLWGWDGALVGAGRVLVRALAWRASLMASEAARSVLPGVTARIRQDSREM